MPYFDRVQAAAVAGNPGMLLAQISWSVQSGKWWLTPGFLAHEYAKLITQKAQP